jgi:hypothetical protein
MAVCGSGRAGLHGFDAMVHRTNDNNELHSRKYALTDEEARLQARYTIVNLASLLEDPEDHLEEAEEGFIVFHESAGKLIEALLGNIEPNPLKVRFGIGGISTELQAPFDMSLKGLESLWKKERPICHWIRQQKFEIEQVSSLGMRFAITHAAMSIREITGMTREQALDAQCYHAYLRQVFVRAFNLYGLFPLKKEELGLKGVDPLAQLIQAKDVTPFRCNAHQLNSWVQQEFDQYRLSFESYSILRHLPSKLSLLEQLKERDWRALLQAELASSWMNGESGQLLEDVLDSLDYLVKSSDMRQA